MARKHGNAPIQNLCLHDLKSVWFKLYHTENSKTLDQDEAYHSRSMLYANSTISGACKHLTEMDLSASAVYTALY